MFLAFDDTDSRKGMCTTYLMARFLSQTGYSIVGFPRLVRLNPNIRHKTRGNGALCVQLGINGSGKSTRIGEFNGKPIYSYDTGEEISDPDVLMKEVIDLVNQYAQTWEEDTNPGIVIMEHRPQHDLYRKALSREIEIGDVEEVLRNEGAVFYKIKNGRGIIGSAAAISWPMQSVTYECISYRYPNYSPPGHERKMEIAEYADSFPNSFNNIDRENDYAAIFPRERTPVIYGIRSEVPDGLLDFSDHLDSSFNLRPEGKVVYATNQGTDDHIVRDPVNIDELGSYSIEGSVTENPSVIEGGHYFSSMRYGTSEIRLAAFEPTKSFRKIFSLLRVGDLIRVYGSFVNNALHVEKMQVIALSRQFVRVLPNCPYCGSHMHTKGKDDFRCVECGKKVRYPDYAEQRRELSPGLYDVPVMARRHLSKPFDIEYQKEVLQ